MNFCIPWVWPPRSKVVNLMFPIDNSSDAKMRKAKIHLKWWINSVKSKKIQFVILIFDYYNSQGKFMFKKKTNFNGQRTV